jgi:superfamily I DNA and/or RNA helicase
MPQTHLLWHYRSRHESLIAYSNARFYESKLYTFPSVNDRECKVSLIHVDGVFERGKQRQNRAEAEAIIAELKRRCHDPLLRNQSVGIVTFNINQQHLIDDLLSDACREDPDLETWAFQSEEPLFIKNLENVQGDERDVILFSIGYGPDENGKVYMNFGPLNRDGGWRRLNVAITRARQEMTVYATLKPEQIDLNRTSAQGVSALKGFLTYAQTKQLPVDDTSVSIQADTRAGIADSICTFLEEQGYETVRSVGSSKYRIDIGVVDPQNPDSYLLGILLDGSSYGTSKTTRDREVAQISVLNGLGWNIHRV